MNTQHISIWLTLLVAVCIGAPAQADIKHQRFKLLASDGAAEDQFGASVATNGIIAVLGAEFNDANGANSGSAYVFNITTGEQLFKLLPDDGAAGDHFGGSVAVSGTITVITANDDNDNGSLSGSAYVFDVTTGQQLFKLLPDDGSAFGRFGSSVAVNETTIVVGSRDSAYVFDVLTGQQLFKLLPDDGAAGQGFGKSVSVSETIAVIGASRDNDNGGNSGSAYLFDVTTGLQLFKLLPDDGAATNFFGGSVAVNGMRAIVGATGASDNGFFSGAAYVFDVTTGLQLLKLLASDGASLDTFGSSVALSGTIAVIGAASDDDSGDASGSAFAFDTTTGRELFKLLPGDLLSDDGAAGDNLGRTVAVSGTTAVVGSPLGDDNRALSSSGQAYVFDVSLAADLNGDGCVDAADLAQLLGAWGTVDLDSNGFTNGADLALLLGSWRQGCS